MGAPRRADPPGLGALGGHPLGAPARPKLGGEGRTRGSAPQPFNVATMDNYLIFFKKKLSKTIYRMEEKKEVERKRSAQRSGESEATNTEVTTSRSEVIFSILKYNSCKKSYFITIHPYMKDSKSPTTVGKVYDRLKRKFDHLFIVKEFTQKENPHFHILGVSTKEVTLDLKHCKTWCQKLSYGLHDIPEFQEILQEFEDGWSPQDANIEMLEALPEDIHRSKKASAFARRYHTVEQQMKSIINYMLKTNPTIEYDEWLLK